MIWTRNLELLPDIPAVPLRPARGAVVFFLAMVLVGSGASAEVVRVADLNSRQIRALDREKTVVFLQGGMLGTASRSTPVQTSIH